ncbi:MAG: sigma-70 family RNA polymerase sigma factor [Planctomycetales bacterium]|nr:sigma-70 family RNA polymerase sigma factor [Planctomycetales bacterium]
MDDELRSVIRRCLGGDETAMVALVQRFQGQVFGLCYRMLRQRQDAEDMAQETFVRALRNLGSWDSTREFEPWLLAIAGNRCRTLMAKRMKKPTPQTLVAPVVDGRPDPTPGRILAEEVELGLAQLRDEYRAAFVLFHEQELSYAEIGDALGCPLGTVKTWVHRARRELIEFLRVRGVFEEAGHAARAV